LTINLRPHQERAFESLAKHDKGQIIVPTGGGKTYIMIADALRSTDWREDSTTVVVAPRILLAQQLCSEFTSVLGAEHVVHVHSGETEHFSTTDRDELLLWHLMSPVSAHRVIFTTYHSLHRVVEAGIPVDTVYFDEAHNSCGKSHFVAVEQVSQSAERCYFFTATPRQGKGSTAYRGMNNAEVYGEVIAQVSATELINSGIILPPKLTPFETDRERCKADAHEVDAENLKDIIDGFDSNAKILVAAPSTRILWRMLSDTDILDWLKQQNYEVMHITSKHGAYVNGKKVRRDVFFNTLSDWGNSNRRFVVFHYSILSEGINVPGLTHTVLLRNLPIIEMAQTIGRVIRVHPDDRKDVEDGIIPAAQFSLYRKGYGSVTVPLTGKYGARIAERLEQVVTSIFIEGIPPLAWTS